MKTILAVIALMSATASAEPEVPAGVAGQLPSGYEVIASAKVVVERPIRSFEIVVLARRNEDRLRQGPQGAPARPLLVFEERGARFALVGRNDHVVMKADEGGQCDPFLNGDATIATKGRYFTVENGVACGQHWTDYITFRFDERAGGFVFDNERQEAWELNPSNEPNAEALVRAGPARVIRDHPGHVTMFASWRPEH